MTIRRFQPLDCHAQRAGASAGKSPTLLRYTRSRAVHLRAGRNLPWHCTCWRHMWWAFFPLGGMQASCGRSVDRTLIVRARSGDLPKKRNARVLVTGAQLLGRWLELKSCEAASVLRSHPTTSSTRRDRKRVDRPLLVGSARRSISRSRPQTLAHPLIERRLRPFALT